MKNKNTSKKICGFALAAIALFAGVGLVSTLVNNPIVEESESEFNSQIVNNGVTLRMLSTNNNADGSVTKTFSFTVTPANATNQNVTAVAKYKDATDCSAVVTVSVNNTSKTIAITCKAAFAKQVIVTVTSSDNSSATGTVTLDYVKKLLSMTDKTDGADYYYYGNGYTSATSGYASSLAPTALMTPSYSVYTKDKTYTYTTTVTSIELDETNFSSSYLSKVASTDAYDNLAIFLEQQLVAKSTASTFDAQTIWNMSSSNYWHSFLKDVGSATPTDSSNYICYIVSMNITCDQDSTKSISGDYSFAISLKNDYSTYSVSVDSISLETGAIEF